MPISVLHYAAAVVTATGSISPSIDDNNDIDNSHEPYFMAFTRWPRHGTTRDKGWLDRGGSENTEKVSTPELSGTRLFLFVVGVLIN